MRTYQARLSVADDAPLRAYAPGLPARFFGDGFHRTAGYVRDGRVRQIGDDVGIRKQKGAVSGAADEAAAGSFIPFHDHQGIAMVVRKINRGRWFGRRRQSVGVLRGWIRRWNEGTSFRGFRRGVVRGHRFRSGNV